MAQNRLGVGSSPGGRPHAPRAKGGARWSPVGGSEPPHPRRERGAGELLFKHASKSNVSKTKHTKKFTHRKKSKERGDPRGSPGGKRPAQLQRPWLFLRNTKKKKKKLENK